MVTYEHKQKGSWQFFLVVAGLISTAVIYAVILLNAQHPIRENTTSLIVFLTSGVTAFLALIWACAMMHSLTVTIDDRNLKVKFGPGAFSKKFLLDDITQSSPVQNSWIYGWGIRWFGKGWLYNVAGSDAVEIKMQSGKTVRIGTDEPQNLSSRIKAVIDNA